MSDELKKQTDDYGQHERELNRLDRDLDVKRELYKDLLHRHEMARVTRSLSIFEQEKRIKVIDVPFTPVLPSNPPLYLFIIAGLLGGIFLGCGLAVVLELIDTTLRRCDQLESLTKVNVISRIPPISPTSEDMLCQR